MTEKYQSSKEPVGTKDNRGDEKDDNLSFWESWEWGPYYSRMLDPHQGIEQQTKFESVEKEEIVNTRSCIGGFSKRGPTF